MANSKDFIDSIEELGPNWVEAPPRAPIIPGAPAPPPVGALNPSSPKYLIGSLPPSFQHDTHFVDTELRTPSAPKFSLMPLGPQQNAVTSAQINSAIRTVVPSIIVETPPATGGSINGTGSNPFVPYFSAADELSDSTFTFNPTGNVLGNSSTTSEIELISGGNDIELAINTGASFPTFLDITDSAGDNFFVGLRPAVNEIEFSVSDSAGDGVGFTVENGFGVEGTINGASGSDNIFLDVKTNEALVELESGLGGSGIWELRTSGASDFEMLDQAHSFFEVFQDGTRASFLTIQDSTNANSATIDINKTVVGTCALTLKSPSPAIFMGSATGLLLPAGQALQHPRRVRRGQSI